ncbi:MAG: TIGR04141 family sporadically distributed protein [Oligoflexales bacterium]
MPKKKKLKEEAVYRSFNIFRLRALENLKDLIAPKRKPYVQFFEISKLLKFKGLVVIQRQNERPPDWIDFVQSSVEAKLASLTNKSSSAVILVNIGTDVLGFCFGYGRFLLEEKYVDGTFGLRFALNSLDPLRIKSIDSKKMTDFLFSRHQTAVEKNVMNFGMDVESDLLHAVAGKPLDTELGTHIAGRDAAIIRSNIKISQLGDFSKKIVKIYASDVYKENFEWVDNIEQVKDKSLIENLNDLIIEKLNVKKKTVKNYEISLAEKEILDWYSAATFHYSFKNSKKFPTLNISDLIDSLEGQALSLEKLFKCHVIVNHEDGQAGARWKIFDTLYCDFNEGNSKYILTSGTWYQIDSSFAKKVSNDIGKIAASKLALPNAKLIPDKERKLHVEHEGDYNKRVGKALGLTVFDAQTIQCAGRQKIEFCDLFSEKLIKIHVKRGSCSAELSHLFNQGVVSAEMLADPDPSFRTNIRKKLKEKKNPLYHLFEDDQPNTADYEITYAIIDPRDSTRWPHSLPFFSQVSLRNSSRYLKSLGYKVSLARIGLGASSSTKKKKAASTHRKPRG